MTYSPICLMVIWLQLNGIASAGYCTAENKSSISFCQSGTLSDKNDLYINGTTIMHSDELGQRGCVCHLTQSGKSEIAIRGSDSCTFCGLQLQIGNDFFKSDNLGGFPQRWGTYLTANQTITMIMSKYGSSNFLNPAFCIQISWNKPPDGTPGTLSLTCEGLNMMTTASLSAVTTSVTFPTDLSTITANTRKSLATVSTTQSKSTTKELKTTQEISTSKQDTPPPTATRQTYSLTISDLKIGQYTSTSNNYAHNSTTISTHKRYEEVSSPALINVIIPAAVGGGAGMFLVILIIVVLGCYIRFPSYGLHDQLKLITNIAIIQQDRLNTYLR